MLTKIWVVFGSLLMTSVFAATDVNQASEAELDSVKGIGPATTRLIIAEREKSEFRNWDDFIKRVKGMGSKNAVKYSAAGLTVGGAAYEAPVKTGDKASSVKD